MKAWGRFTFVAEYGGKEIRKSFDEKLIRSMFDELRPKPPPPFVTRRKANP
jgi:hypothetical protein